MERIGEDIAIRFVDDASDGSVVSVLATVRGGRLLMMADIETYYGRELVIAGLHIQSEGLQPNSLGWPVLRQVAQAVAEKADVDVIVVKGAVRTTGANPGRLPRHLRFTRAVPSER